MRKKTPGIFIFIDVDNFKIYNDTYGHNNGDFCLKHFAKTMKSCFPEDSIIGRYGGDEFVVIYPGILEQQFEFLMSQLRLNARQHHVSFSCGAVWKKECDSLDALLKEADEKMYEEKKHFYEKTEHDRRREIRRSEHV